VGPERGPLSLESTIEELLERQSSGSGLVRTRAQAMEFFYNTCSLLRLCKDRPST
jgi:hypothetical protein